MHQTTLPWKIASFLFLLSNKSRGKLLKKITYTFQKNQQKKINKITKKNQKSQKKSKKSRTHFLK